MFVNMESKLGAILNVEKLFINSYYNAEFILGTNSLPQIGNRSFPSSLVPPLQNESRCKTFHRKMSSACSFIFMQIKVIFIRVVSHLDSLWNRGTRELVIGLFIWQGWIRVHASTNVLFLWTRQRIKSPEYHHMICIGKTKCTSEKGLWCR